MKIYYTARYTPGLVTLSRRAATAARPDSSVTESVREKEEDMVVGNDPPTKDISKRISQCKTSALWSQGKIWEVYLEGQIPLQVEV